ncbi:MAG: ABC transporter substrate-binding protein [Eubacteriales bacterium]|nr:ABC transporter substrate-binding protein [Eubacteriales bacterium]MDD3881943.1 ABC transporter substrate-binding protein [Eubacteriales bacterium]MDD4513816.1 ABC transporter substrate-binding protein [Eubacteriales bacterium]
MNKSLRGILSSALSILLALALFVPGAFAASTDLDIPVVDETKETYAYVDTFTGDGTNVYALHSGSNEEGVYYSAIEKYTAGAASHTRYATITDGEMSDEESELYNELRPQRIIFFEGKLYGINTDNGALCVIPESGNEVAKLQKVTTLDFSSLMVEDGDYSWMPGFYCTFVESGKLYGLSMGNETVVSSFDIESGDLVKTYDLENIRSIFPYDEETMFALQMDYNQEVKEGEIIAPTLMTVNLESGETAEIGKMPADNLGYFVYDDSTDLIYCVGGGIVYGISPKDASATKVNYVSGAYGNNSALGVMLGKDYAIYSSVSNYANLFIRSTDPSQMPESALSISGGWADDPSIKAAKAIGNVPLLFPDAYYSTAEEVVQSMTGSQNVIDIYMLSTGYSGLSALIDKGYAYDMSANSDITSFISGLYPIYRDYLMRDGKVVGVPTSSYTGNVQAFSYNAEALEAAGLTAADLPTTWEGLFDFIINWCDNLADEHPEYSPIVETYTEREVTNKLISAYVDYYQSHNMVLDFDTELFRTLIQKKEIAYQKLVNKGLNYEINWEEIYSGNGDGEYPSARFTPIILMSQASLLQIYADYYTATNSVTPFDISMVSGEAPSYPMNLNVMVVNPASPNKELAAKFLAEYVKNIIAENLYTLTPENNVPVENPYFEQNRKWYVDYIAQLQEQLKTASDEDKEWIQQDLDYFTDYLANDFEKSRYQISAESIERYQSDMKKAYIAEQSIVYTSDDFYAFMDQYSNKQITLDEFIQKINQKVKMSLMEDDM